MMDYTAQAIFKSAFIDFTLCGNKEKPICTRNGRGHVKKVFKKNSNSKDEGKCRWSQTQTLFVCHKFRYCMAYCMNILFMYYKL